MKTKEDLDELASGRCSNPQCKHEDCGSEIWLHPGCHPASPTRASYFHGVLSISCAKCGHHVLSVETTREPEPLCCPAHKVKPIWARYVAGSGELDLECAKCKRIFGIVLLKQ